MRLYLRGQTWHCDFAWTHPTTGARERFRGATRESSKRAAEEVAHAMKRQLESSPPPPPPEPTPEPQPSCASVAFADYAERWMTLIRPKKKPSTLRGYRQILDVHLIPRWGRKDLRRIKPSDVEVYQADKALTLAPKTVSNHISVLSSLFAHAVKRGLADHNPCEGIEPIQDTPDEMRFWSRDESEAFLAAMDEVDHRWTTFYATALYTGLRLGELFALRWDDVDFRSGQVHVRQSMFWEPKQGRSRRSYLITTPKSGRSRTVPMPPVLSDRLKAYRHLRGPWVFCLDDGSPLHRDNIKHGLITGTRLARLPTIRLHDLRHSYASQLVMAAAPLRVVQSLLGHAHITTTERYAHLSPGLDHAMVLAAFASRHGTSTAQAATPNGGDGS
jgi:integrase